MIKKVCVYCASSDKVAESYFAGAAHLGRALAEAGVTIVYGGGSSGLMGRLADAALAAKGQVVGIIPHFMTEVEWQHNGLTKLVLVNDMHERKRLFLEEVDAVVTLPGGCGTLEELLEVITLKRLGVFTRPIIIVNQDGYYDPLVTMLEKAISEKFMGEQHRDIWSVVDRVDRVLEAIAQAPPWQSDAIKRAKA
ncbi:MAG: TIGR00730 family Rossman fold protein [Bacteroidota bacterium]